MTNIVQFPHFLVYFAVSLLALQTTTVKSDPLAFINTYKKGPIILSSTTTLYHEANPSLNLIKLGVKFNDTAVLSSSSSPSAWVGIGIGEPTSGSMLGADIVTAEFSSSNTQNCTIVDRYVPFSAYPLREAPGPFPLPDECEEPDWKLIHCARDKDNGLVTIEVERPLNVTDEAQDRSILPGSSVFMTAYGGNFGYHGDKRLSTRVIFYENEKNDAADGILPKDISGSFEMLATNYTIPTRDTTYACTTVQVPVGPVDGDRMIVAIEPIIKPNMESIVHHFTLYLCAGEEYAKLTKKTTACDQDKQPFGPLGNSLAKCTNFVYGYAKGAGRLVYPEEVGVLLKSSRSYLVMETHFDNPSGTSGLIDDSGLRVYYTDKKRKHIAGSLLLGDSTVSLFDQTVQSGFRYQFSCPTACTSRMQQPVNLFTSFLHMHTTGKEIYTNLYSADNKFIRNINKVNFWSDSFQQNRVLKSSVTLKPGQQLQTSCIFDTSKRPNTKFGVRTKDEMCMDFILYWPLQKDPKTGHEFNLCNFFATREGNITMCAEGGRIDEFSKSPEKFPQSKNPAFNDTVGAPTKFANEPETCDELGAVTPAPNPTDSDLPESTPASNPTDSDLPESTPASNPTDSDLPESTSESNSTESDAVCFPSNAIVRLRSGDLVTMEELKVGDEVLVGKSEFSTVFMFTHADKYIQHPFVSIRSSENSMPLLVSAGHYIYVNGELMEAQNVRKGDMLRDENGNEVEVVEKSIQWSKGLYNPQTEHGDIIVNGIVASTFTKEVKPTTAKALLSPVKLLYETIGLDFSFIFASEAHSKRLQKIKKVVMNLIIVDKQK